MYLNVMTENQIPTLGDMDTKSRSSFSPEEKVCSRMIVASHVFPRHPNL